MSGTQTPVFVDPSGRRARTARWLGALAGAACLSYLVLVGVALVASPGVLSIGGLDALLPDTKAPSLAEPAARPARPAAVLTTRPRPATTTPATTTPAATTPAASPRPVPSPTLVVVNPAGRVVPSKTVEPTASAEASPTARRTGRPTEPPGRGRR